MSSLFCRHNRFTADCPICSKGTVLDSAARQAARPRAATQPRPARKGTHRSGAAATVARTVTGPYVSAGPYEWEDGERYDVRLERVPGGVRLAAWAAGSIERRAPELGVLDLPRLVDDAREREVLPPRELDPIARALTAEPRDEANGSDHGASPGRAGDLREELRVEACEGARLRIARWLYRPNQGWEIQEAPVLVPGKRLAEAIRDAAVKGVLRRALGPAV